MPLADRPTVRQSYQRGVDAVEAVTGSLSIEQWTRPACGTWSAADTVRHLLTVADWYHSWLDRAIAEDVHVPFPPDEMDDQTARSLAEVQHIEPVDARISFLTRARSYLDRLDDQTWDVPFAYPRGIVTPGLHAGIAAVEWHVHAWDLSSATGRLHEPEDPVGLFLGAAACNAAASGRIASRLVRTLAPIASRRDPWGELLQRTGRDPNHESARI